MKRFIIFFLTLGCTTLAPVAPKEITAESVKSCLGKVYNRGTVPLTLVKDIIEAVRAEPDSVFAPNGSYDVYSSVAAQLGPYESIKHRRAVMANVMMVEAGFESSWNYHDGRDTTANNTSACTSEAGLYQTSGNMNTYLEPRQELIDLQAKYCRSTTCTEFRRCTMEPVKPFVHAHFMRATRITVKHWGPIKRKEINPWLSRACVKEVEALL